MRLPAPRGFAWLVAMATCAILLTHSLEPTSAKADETSSAVPSNPKGWGAASPLPLPSTTSIRDMESKLFPFVRERKYVDLGWSVDKSVRDTGPYIRGWYYGTHPVVRVYYSPEMMKWLISDRLDHIPDGATMIKEQYSFPAAKHEGKSEQELIDSIRSWTVMIKDAKGSYDGWFWSNPLNNDEPPQDNHAYHPTHGFRHPESGFGHYCIRCHAATQSFGKTNEFTFASLRNIAGYKGHPLLFRSDQSWRNPPKPKPKVAENLLVVTAVQGDDVGSHPRCTAAPGAKPCPIEFNEPFAKLFRTIPRLSEDKVRHMPPVTHDWVVRAAPSAAASQQFVTSNQCMSCHAALVGDFGPTMFAHTVDASQIKNGMSQYSAPGIDYSPYGEWRWTPMGLAGRDPIFYAQMAAELAILKKEFADKPATHDMVSKNLVETCLRCHGAMGKHQFDFDHRDKPGHFGLEHIYSNAGVDKMPTQHEAYGALARDGISCTVCHRMQPRPQPDGDNRPYLKYFLETSITGNLHLGPPNEIYGPFKDKEIAPYMMEHGMGFKPKHSDYIQSSRMCGTCHTVNLPIVDRPYMPDEKKNELALAESIPEFREFHHHVEQATYLEWLNSEFENEFNTDNPKSQSCQDCHMSRDLQSPRYGIDIKKLKTRIAIVQDRTYPDAENLTNPENLNIRWRKEGFARHNFSGLNVFLVEMFNQFDKVLGVRKVDYMTGTEQIPHAIENFRLTAEHKTANLRVTATQLAPHKLEAQVTIENKVGHRFPSGVGFRRAFIELLLLDDTKQGDDAILWSSGRTNELGVILGEDQKPLGSEFFDHDDQGQERYQPHHSIITSPDQVQIYETLLRNVKEEFTTSFIHGCTTVKDNRLLPRGWTRRGPNPAALNGYFLKSTYPHGLAEIDPRYANGSGSDVTKYRVSLPRDVNLKQVTLKATLYYQAIPPYFLKEIFETAPESDAAQRLHYICSNLNLAGTLIENWKLKVVSDECKVDAP